MHASLRAFGMVTPNFRAPPKVFIILLNRPSRLIRQYFPRQLVQVSLFANILPRQNFPTYGICVVRCFVLPGANKEQSVSNLYQWLDDVAMQPGLTHSFQW